MLSISRDHPLVSTEGIAGLCRVEVDKEPGRRNLMPWPQKASRHLGLRVSEAPGSGAATLLGDSRYLGPEGERYLSKTFLSPR